LQPSFLLKAKLKEISGSAVTGLFYRSIDYRYISDPLNSIGSTIHGGRYNQKGTFEVLYLAPDQETAQKEALKSLSKYIPPRVFLTIDVLLSKLINLEEDQVIQLLGIKKELLSSNWIVADGESYTQKLGRIIYESELFEGIRYPSAQVAGKYNLAIFSDRLQKNSFVKVYDPHHNLRGELEG